MSDSGACAPPWDAAWLAFGSLAAWDSAWLAFGSLASWDSASVAALPRLVGLAAFGRSSGAPQVCGAR
jgi:hypothetical protein